MEFNSQSSLGDLYRELKQIFEPDTIPNPIDPEFYKNAKVTDSRPVWSFPQKKLLEQYPNMIKFKIYRGPNGERRKVVEIEVGSNESRCGRDWK